MFYTQTQNFILKFFFHFSFLSLQDRLYLPSLNSQFCNQYLPYCVTHTPEWGSFTWETAPCSAGDAYHRDGQFQPEGDPANNQSQHTEQANPGERERERVETCTWSCFIFNGFHPSTIKYTIQKHNLVFSGLYLICKIGRKRRMELLKVIYAEFKRKWKSMCHAVGMWSWMK